MLRGLICMIASPTRVRFRSFPLWIVSVAAAASVVVAPFWSGLLIGELAPVCEMVPRLESDPSCSPGHRPLVAAALFVFVVHCACIYAVIVAAVRALRSERAASSLASAAAVALSPLAVAVLFATSSEYTTSAAFWLALGLCAGAAAAAIGASKARGIVVRCALAGLCMVLVVAATATVFAVIPATLLAAGAIVAWFVAQLRTSTPLRESELASAPRVVP